MFNRQTINKGVKCFALLLLAINYFKNVSVIPSNEIETIHPTITTAAITRSFYAQQTNYSPVFSYLNLTISR